MAARAKNAEEKTDKNSITQPARGGHEAFLSVCTLPSTGTPGVRLGLFSLSEVKIEQLHLWRLPLTPAHSCQPEQDAELPVCFVHLLRLSPLNTARKLLGDI